MNIQLQRCAARDQAEFDLESFYRWIGPGGDVWAEFYHLAAGTLVRFPNLADFEISADGHDVRCWPVAGVSEATLDHLYLNQVMPLALSRAGQNVFHAGAVSLGEGCVAFMGASGKGKSTLVASFATTGHPLLTDDCLLVDTGGAAPCVVPGHSSVRLWRDSEAALLPPAAEKAPQVGYTTKARFTASGELAYCADTKPLRCVFILGDGSVEHVQVRSLSQSQAMMELVRHSILLDVDQQQAIARHFHELAELAHRCRFFSLDYPRQYPALPAVRAAIVEHVRDV